jgi:prolyl-tRNA synthetase
VSKELGITSREENFSDWYNELVLRSDLADYSPVRGCMVIKPHGYAIWESIQRALDDMFKETGHQNAYFPLLIPESFMTKEAEHVEGFAPECAIVTHGGGKELEEPLYIRPTSETIIWNTFSKWIQSYRDLPLLINQWANVVRWEMRTRLFLRTTEFLWQEGHTAHATSEEAEEETLKMLDCYRKLAEEWLAIPVIVGRKTEVEKFAGAEKTYCIEALTQDLRAIQAGTSHNLGQNFAKAFNVTYANPEGARDYVYATSWGVSTRLIGTLIMVHSDDKGLVLPPAVAPVQVVIVPISRNEETRAKVYEVAEQLNALLKKQTFKECKLRVHIDKRDKETPGFKFNDWELKGACLRIELGPKDIEKESCIIARRDTGEKKVVAWTDLVAQVEQELIEMHQNLFNKAKTFRQSHTKRVDTWEDFEKQFAHEGGAGFVLAHWDGSSETEREIANRTKATIRCIPLQALDPEDLQPGKCVLTGKPSKNRVIFAKAY